MKRILMIEDDQDTSDLISTSVRKKFGCTVDVAQDPFEAMELLTEHFYDLIILDWQLPGLNGTETLVRAERSLKMEPELPVQWDNAKVPVVIFSASKKEDCLPPRTKHFNYAGHISKSQPLSAILELLGERLITEKVPSYQTA